MARMLMTYLISADKNNVCHEERSRRHALFNEIIIIKYPKK